MSVGLCCENFGVRAFVGIVQVPVLGAAACVGRHEMFDTTDPADPRAREAAGICRACPELTACGQWLNSLPLRARPTGTVAGVFLEKPGARGRRLPIRPAPVTVSADAQTWLAARLASGPVPAARVYADAAAAGFGKTTTRHARHAIGAASEPIPGAAGGNRVWSLPTEERGKTMPDPLSDEIALAVPFSYFDADDLCRRTGVADAVSAPITRESIARRRAEAGGPGAA